MSARGSKLSDRMASPSGVLSWTITHPASWPRQLLTLNVTSKSQARGSPRDTPASSALQESFPSMGWRCQLSSSADTPTPPRAGPAPGNPRFHPWHRAHFTRKRAVLGFLQQARGTTHHPTSVYSLKLTYAPSVCFFPVDSIPSSLGLPPFLFLSPSFPLSEKELSPTCFSSSSLFTKHF